MRLYLNPHVDHRLHVNITISADSINFNKPFPQYELRNYYMELILKFQFVVLSSGIESGISNS